MKTEKKSIWGVLLIALLLLSTACGSKQTAQEPVQETEAVAGGEYSPKNNTEDPKRIVKSVKGDIEVPAEPKRVIGLSVVYPEFLYALGITPVAVQNYHPEFPSYLKEPFKDTLKMGIAKTPNFEAILSAKPDLIIAPVWWADKDYDQLSKIAPTILLPERDMWTDELLDIAEVLNKKDIADKVIREYEQKTMDAKKKLQAAIGNETVMYMMIMPKELIVYGEKQTRGIFIHKELGLKPVSVFPESEVSVSLSMEKFPEYNPDHIILQLDNADDKEVQRKYEELKESALWRNLTAVKKNHVYTMGSMEWFSLGMSPLANDNAVDDMLNAILYKK